MSDQKHTNKECDAAEPTRITGEEHSDEVPERTSMIRILRTRTDYDEALARLDVLMAAAPAPGTPESDELDVLSLLIEDFEARHATVPVVDPVEAIRFRMDQLGLQQRDLVPYLGSRARVSEVLSGKRSLSLSMIRALHRGLGIPLTSLLGDRDPGALEEHEVEWDRFPVREMVARGWVSVRGLLSGTAASGRAAAGAFRQNARELLEGFFAPLGGPAAATALYRQGEHIRGARESDVYALTAWTARVLIRAVEESPVPRQRADLLDVASIRQLVKLSRLPDGPLTAISFLRDRGVNVVVEPHLPRTYLDGAAIRAPRGQLVIGLTLRHDRLDNFWFTLFHELAHITRHLSGVDVSAGSDEVTRFYDDLDATAEGDAREKEADAVAGEWLVPADVWETSAARYVKSPEAVDQLATELQISSAIVAGKVRHFYNDYRVLNHLIGHGAVRSLFPGFHWDKA